MELRGVAPECRLCQFYLSEAEATCFYWVEKEPSKKSELFRETKE